MFGRVLIGAEEGFGDAMGVSGCRGILTGYCDKQAIEYEMVIVERCRCRQKFEVDSKLAMCRLGNHHRQDFW